MSPAARLEKVRGLVVSGIIVQRETVATMLDVTPDEADQLIAVWLASPHDRCPTCGKPLEEPG